MNLAKLVECVVCGNNYAITDEQYNSSKKAANSLKTVGEIKFICKSCAKMVKTN